jgi:hypothetical protein
MYRYSGESGIRHRRPAQRSSSFVQYLSVAPSGLQIPVGGFEFGVNLRPIVTCSGMLGTNAIPPRRTFTE